MSVMLIFCSISIDAATMDRDLVSEAYTDEDHSDLVNALDDESENDDFCEWIHCDNDLSSPRGFRKYLDLPFLKKVVRNLNPFKSTKMNMRFFLFKKQFPECGREISIMDTNSVYTSGFNASHPTRFAIKVKISLIRF